MADTARVNLPGSSNFGILPNDGEEVKSATWTCTDGEGVPITLPEWTAANTPNLSKRTLAPNEITLVCGDRPSHSRLTLNATVTFAQPGKPARTASQSWTILFNALWGGVAKASYPYPVDWGPPCKPWGSDKKGQRALVLMYDLINQMPESLRQAAGAMPIARIDSLPLDIGGFNAPYFSDCILMTDDFVERLGVDASGKGSPMLTPDDLTFVSVVLHEMGHAATYKRSSLGLHQALGPVLHALRSLPAVPAAYLISVKLPLLISAIDAIVANDFVSGFARVAGWELACWPLQLMRAASVYEVIDLLSNVPRQLGVLPTIYPNVITGYFGIGNALGLKNDEIAFSMIQRLQNEMNSAADPATYQKKRDELQAALASAGAVTQYATTDVLEDIAETITAITFTADQLKQQSGKGPYFTTHADGSVSEGFAKRRKYLEDEQLFPKDWKQLVPGTFMRGDDKADHLDDWQVTL
jgi:hypothetical protein